MASHGFVCTSIITKGSPNPGPSVPGGYRVNPNPAFSTDPCRPENGEVLISGAPELIPPPPPKTHAHVTITIAMAVGLPSSKKTIVMEERRCDGPLCPSGGLPPDTVSPLPWQCDLPLHSTWRPKCIPLQYLGFQRNQPSSAVPTVTPIGRGRARCERGHHLPRAQVHWGSPEPAPEIRLSSGAEGICSRTVDYWGAIEPQSRTPPPTKGRH